MVLKYFKHTPEVVASIEVTTVTENNYQLGDKITLESIKEVNISLLIFSYHIACREESVVSKAQSL